MKYELTNAAAKRIGSALRSTERPITYQRVLEAMRAEEIFAPVRHVLDLYRALLIVDTPMASLIAQAAINAARDYRETLRDVSTAFEMVRRFDEDCAINQPEETK